MSKPRSNLDASMGLFGHAYHAFGNPSYVWSPHLFYTVCSATHCTTVYFGLSTKAHACPGIPSSPEVFCRPNGTAYIVEGADFVPLPEDPLAVRPDEDKCDVLQVGVCIASGSVYGAGREVAAH